jgi:hypothetical protein
MDVEIAAGRRLPDLKRELPDPDKAGVRHRKRNRLR